MADLGPDDLRRMQGLAQEVTAIRPELLNGDATVGELAWVWAKDVHVLAPYWRHRLWFVDDKLVAWGWVCLPFRIPRGDGTFRESKVAHLTWQTHPDRPVLLNEILDWYDDVAGDSNRLVIVQSADDAAQTIAAEHGFMVDADDDDWIQFNMRDMTDLPDPMLPEDFRLLCADDVTPADAVQAHRDAWYPSVFSEAAFEQVQRTWPYRADLHLLIATPDGTMAATAIVWLDEATQMAEFEPVGTHRDYRRRGLGTALQIHGMHRARAAGATRMLVACLGSPAQPAARAMYEGVGFRPITRDLPHFKAAS